MFTPLDWMVHLEASQMSLSPSGQRRFALLAALKAEAGNREKQSASKPPSQAGPAPVHCCEAAAA